MKIKKNHFFLISTLLFFNSCLFLIGSESPLTSLWFVLFAFLCFFAPLSFLKKDSVEFSFENSLLIFAGGLGLFLTLSYLSIFFWKQSYVSAAIFLILFVFGFWKHRKEVFLALEKRSSASSDLFFLTLATLILSYLLNGRNYIWIFGDLIQTWCCDWEVHLFMAKLIHEDGLPMDRMAHRGFQVMMLGITQLSGLPLRESAKILTSYSFLMTVWSLWALLACFGVNRVFRLLLPFFPFFWGSFSFLLDVIFWNVAGFKYAYLDTYIGKSHSSGSSIINLTFLMSHFFVASFLLAFQKFLLLQEKNKLYLSLFLLSLSLLVKPTAFIVFYPALLICFLFLKLPLKDWFLSFLIPAVFIFLYAFPVFLDSYNPEAKQAQQFVIGFRFAKDPLKYLSFLMAFGVLVFPYFLLLVKTPKELLFERRVTLLNFLVIALSGALVFSLFFYEPGKIYHGNQNWSYKGLLLLGGPSFFSFFLTRLKNAFAKKMFLLFACVNVISGALFYYTYAAKKKPILAHRKEAYPSLSFLDYLISYDKREEHREKTEESVKERKQAKKELSAKMKKRASLKAKKIRRRKLKEKEMRH